MQLFKWPVQVKRLRASMNFLVNRPRCSLQFYDLFRGKIRNIYKYADDWNENFNAIKWHIDHGEKLSYFEFISFVTEMQFMRPKGSFVHVWLKRMKFASGKKFYNNKQTSLVFINDGSKQPVILFLHDGSYLKISIEMIEMRCPSRETHLKMNTAARKCKIHNMSISLFCV